LEHTKERGSQIYAETAGYDLSGDGYRIAPDPTGGGTLRAIELSLKDHDINRIDYMNTHATSTTRRNAEDVER
jgi:3-oxoacyl-(acyl-carrier-protein) synthase